jgi:hypothetical protein
VIDGKVAGDVPHVASGVDRCDWIRGVAGDLITVATTGWRCDLH